MIDPFLPVHHYAAAYGHPDFQLEDDVLAWLSVSGARFLDVRGRAPEFCWTGHPDYWLSVTVHSRNQVRTDEVPARYRVLFLATGTGRHLVDLYTGSLPSCVNAQLLYSENTCPGETAPSAPSDASSSTS